MGEGRSRCPYACGSLVIVGGVRKVRGQVGWCGGAGSGNEENQDLSGREAVVARDVGYIIIRWVRGVFRHDESAPTAMGGAHMQEAALGTSSFVGCAAFLGAMNRPLR
jgi:hypothetical protein